ncbi:hypothetical protein B0O99DRAFT_696258 [Bisporella sp. PMI_857]|nr:hypothetical protein B0O99DRAFT_696258 [Bisporella sp. PMI_857]
MALHQSPKKRGGRPRKHRSEADAAKAVRQSKLRSYHRSRQLVGLVSFIAYKPPHSSVPAVTPASGLRTSSDIRIPLDDNVPQNDALSSHRPISPLPTQQPPSNKDIKVATQICKIRIQEQDANLEQREYNAEISRQINKTNKAVAEILIELRFPITKEAQKEQTPAEQKKNELEYTSAGVDMLAKEGLYVAGERDTGSDEERVPFCFSPVAAVDEQSIIA